MSRAGELSSRQRADVEAEFWLRVRKTRGCWYWTGGTAGSFGYGQFYSDPRGPMRAHRWVMRYVVGRRLRRSDRVLHTCDQSLCVRPSHLFVGTQSDNLADMRRKGRRQVRGERVLQSVLTVKDVRRIRRRHSRGTRQCDLAVEYGVSVVTIHDVVRRKTWEHV